MSRRVAILGLGSRGVRWAEGLHQSGWIVSGFDPDTEAGAGLERLDDWSREETISSTVRGADWVVCCLPERLELMQMVMQRAQAEAPRDAIVTVATPGFDADAVQACAIRPGQVFRVAEGDDGVLALDITERNPEEARQVAKDGLAELAAVLSMQVLAEADQERGVESA